MRKTWWAAVAVALTMTVPVAGCAGRDGGDVAGGPSPTAGGPTSPAGPSTPGPSASTVPPADGPTRPPLSATTVPTLRPPTGPPRDPSDSVPTNLVGGFVTRGGAGPCYTVESDDGTVHTLYGPNAGTFPTGSRVRARVAPLKDLTRVCGPGPVVGIVSIDLVR